MKVVTSFNWAVGGISAAVRRHAGGMELKREALLMLTDLRQSPFTCELDVIANADKTAAGDTVQLQG